MFTLAPCIAFWYNSGKQAFSAPNPMSDVLVTPANRMDEKTLRRLLASRKPADKAALESWIQIVSLENAAPHLAEIAQQAVPVWHLRRIYLYLCLLVVIGFTGVSLLMNTLWEKAWSDAYFCGFTVIMSGTWPICFTLSAGHSGRQAVLLLARTGDQRAVEHLARLWIPNPWPRKQAQDNSEITRELTRILTERQGQRYNLACETALRDLLKRAFPRRKGLRRLIPMRDITEADAELLLLVARHIAHIADCGAVRSNANADETTLAQIAATPTKPRQTEINRTLLRDTAQELLTVSVRNGTP